MESRSRQHAPPAVPGYEIMSFLGAGGTSTVWLARQLSLDRVVAIKVLSPALLTDDTAREQFQKEARAAAKLSHPAIVGIVDFGEHDGALFYIMEYVDGTNLAQWVAQNQRMAHGQALKLVNIIAGALDTAWRETGLIHCDIKPGNILLGVDGAVKITDLGLARIAGVAATREASEIIEGTPTYIAPEQIEGRQPDCRSDIYSLGLTLYHILTGKPPFEGRSLNEVIEAQQNDYLPDPCEMLPHLPVSYGWLLAKMTAKDPAKRHQSWTDVLKDIRQIQGGMSPLPPYPGEDESTILLNPRHRPGARAHTINLSAAAAKTITLSVPDTLLGKQKRGSAYTQPTSSRGGGCLRGLFFLIFCGLIGAAIWFFGFYGHPERVEQFKALFTGGAGGPAPEKPNVQVGGSVQQSEVTATVADQPTAAPAPAEAAPEPEPLSASTGTVTPGAWNHPGFIQAATLFNETLTAYQAALRNPDPQNPALVGLIADAQYAALLFETIRPQAPAGVPILQYANQCYQLVNDLRRARLTEDDKRNLYALAPKKRHPTLAPYPTPAPDPSDTFAPRYMQFGYAWDTLPAPVDRPETAEFVFLLSTIAEATPDTRAQPGLFIHGPLNWLMPAADAIRAIGGKADIQRVPIEGAPFPYGGCFLRAYPAGRYGMPGPGQPPYPTLRLITDSDDQLIAVQLVDENPSPPLQSSPMTFTTTSKIMDFVTGRVLSEKGDTRATHRTLKGAGTLRIDSEAADFTSGPDGKPLYRSILLLPQAFANNLLYHLLGSAN
ncbi:MAG TPA: serine/threonine-protein kinase [Kiritimatiellia bacterium]|jgi:serine/threonine protein kinase|nr:serine/threonine-protein kinase [Kiritimatiellia bacterium]